MDAEPVSIDDVLVDTGAELSWFPADVMSRAGVTREKQGQRLQMANGEELTRDIGFARVWCQEFHTVDEVVFGQPGDLTLLGAHTLEGFNAVIDPAHRKLVAAGPIIAAPIEAR